MATLSARLMALEKSTNTAPLVVLCIDGEPTPAQQTTIDHCTRTGRPLFAHHNSTSTGWMPGCGAPPPWEVNHGNA